MEYRLISCNSLIKKITKKDTLFNGVYCVDPYQNCEFECQYCDSSLENTVYVKTNATERLEKEIKYLEKGVIVLLTFHVSISFSHLYNKSISVGSRALKKMVPSCADLFMFFYRN